MVREELQKMKVVDLKAICKERGIPHYKGKSCFRKSELIEAILEVEKSTDNDNADDKNKEKNKVSEQDDKKNIDTGINMNQKMPYIESATKGALVAFRLPNGKVKSAMVVKKSTQNKKFMVETKYGVQYVIGYNDIVWVRSGKRWPKGVYMLLKGQVEEIV